MPRLTIDAPDQKLALVFHPQTGNVVTSAAFVRRPQSHGIPILTGCRPQNRMKSSVVLPITLALGALLLTGCEGRQKSGATPPTSGAGGGGRGASTAPLPVEAFKVTGGSISQSISAVGTLVARESITVVGELSRRLIRVACREGADVEAGALLFLLDDAELRTEFGRLEIRRKLLADTVERQRELLAARTTSQQDFDRALADLQLVEAEMARVRIDLAKTEIRAPFPGRVGLRRVSEGAFVAANTPLSTLQDLSTLKVDFTLPERYADEVKVGLPFSFTVASSAKVFTGKIVAVEPQIDTATRSLVVRGEAENPERRLTPGAFASVEISLTPTDDGIMIPARALVPALKGYSVFIAVDGKAAVREVKLGVRTDDAVQITSGLKVGEVVLTSNLLRLRPGAQVAITSEVTH